jgi:hypothetical protein
MKNELKRKLSVILTVSSLPISLGLFTAILVFGGDPVLALLMAAPIFFSLWVIGYTLFTVFSFRKEQTKEQTK